VLTTNYDDGIERSARDRSLRPFSLLSNDPQILVPPGANELHVVHLHGMPSDPRSLVLPGRTTEELDRNEVFQTFVRSRLAPQGVVHLGFSFARSEVHLHRILGWLNDNVAGTGRHYVLLPEDEIGDLSRFDPYTTVTVVPYTKDPDFTEVEGIALAFAPRADDPPASGSHVTWVEPVLMSVAPDDDEERLRQRAWSFDLDASGSDEARSVKDALKSPRILLTGGPGMGKSTLAHRLWTSSDSRPTALANLRDFSPATGDDPPEQAIIRLLRTPDDEALGVDILDNRAAQLFLDGLDEVRDDVVPAAVAAIAEALKRWPNHSWVITSRPTTFAPTLRAEDVQEFRIMPSRRWALRYLETRSVPPQRVRRAMLDGYGLGDLMSIPLFAERLADRLLEDRTADLTPLDLLVDEQYAATAREARRHEHHEADLGQWMRSLAIALELRGRTSAQLHELARFEAPSGVTGVSARARLVRASLLADVPDIAAFPRKTLAEGLCARAILDTDDPVSTVRRIAVADVGGAPRLRDDMEFVLDLVFEHADAGTRHALRTLDEQRWARTVVTGGDLAEAREALTTLTDWHAERYLPFGAIGEGGLRTAAGAVRAMIQRWPELVEERRASVERDARAAHLATCERALAALGAMPRDSRTSTWLLPCLDDHRPRVARPAAALAAELHVAEAVPQLRILLSSDDRDVRTAALRALVELLDVAELPALAREIKGLDGLRPVARRLHERVDLDTGIAVAGSARQLSATTAWLIDRLIDDAHPDAWNSARVEALMRACASIGGERPDPQRLARVFARHPLTAIDAVRLSTVGDEPWGSAAQLLALSQLDPGLLAGEAHAKLRRAIANVLRDEDEIRNRTVGPGLGLGRLARAIQERGSDLPLDVVANAHQLRTLSHEQREILAELVDQWWPADGFSHAGGDASREGHRRQLVAVRVGAELELPLADARWAELFDAHFATNPWEQFDLGGDDVAWWLAKKRPPDADARLLEAIAAAEDGRVLSRLIGITSVGPRSDALTEALFSRLSALGPSRSPWLNAVGMLIEAGELVRARGLLLADTTHEIRQAVIDRLAAAGARQPSASS